MAIPVVGVFLGIASAPPPPPRVLRHLVPHNDKEGGCLTMTKGGCHYQPLFPLSLRAEALSIVKGEGVAIPVVGVFLGIASAPPPPPRLLRHWVPHNDKEGGCLAMTKIVCHSEGAQRPKNLLKYTPGEASLARGDSVDLSLTLLTLEWKSREF